jgi:hypothetical protein
MGSVIRIVDDDDADAGVIRVVADDDDIVEDGGSVRVRMAVMDGTDLSHHRPGFRVSDEASKSPTVGDMDAARDAARSARVAWIADMQDAWRMDARPKKKPPPDDDDDDDDDGGRSTTDARQAARDAYDGMVRRAENAWRMGPVRDAAEPDTSSSAETMRKHLRTDPDNDVQAKRDKAYRGYTTALSEAWKTPGVHPQPAKVGPGPSGLIAATESPDPTTRARQIERQGEAWRGGK